ncbi:MAG: hypothetical protein DRI65_18380 [Chloroflexota bacterium]|nr:MAG: hypothetical protein DRI65_18380 [Chloroflexota bacterium]
MPKPKKASSLPIKVPHPLNLNEAAQEVASYIGQGDTSIFEPVPTGFPTLDPLLGGSDDQTGGFYPEDLWLLAGAQGVGKTSLALQMAHNIGKEDILPIFVCYEHTPITLWERMICQVSGIVAGKGNKMDHSLLVKMADLRKAYQDMIESYRGDDFGQEKLIDELLKYLPQPQKVWAEFAKAASHVWLIKGDPLYTTPDALESYVKMAQDEGHKRIVLFVDYVQRIPVSPQYGRLLGTMERIEFSLRVLKGIAMTYLIPVVGVSAADAEGLRKGRIHLENMWGNATMQYEPDGALVLNRDIPKDGAERVRLSIEKSRRGQSEIEIWYPFYGSAYHFGFPGERVPDDKSWQNERVSLQPRKEGVGEFPVLLEEE